MSSKSGPGYRGYEANPVAMASLSVENLFNTPYSRYPDVLLVGADGAPAELDRGQDHVVNTLVRQMICLLYTSDAADE